MIESAMNSIERVEAVLDLQIPDRIPVAPLIAAHAAKVAGISVRDFFFNFQKSQKAARKVFELYKGLDIITFIPGGVGLLYDSPFINSHSRLFFDWEFPENVPPQMREHPLMSANDYDRIIDEGVIPWLKRPQDYQLQRIFTMQTQMKKELRYWMRERQTHTFISATTISPFDLLSHLRGMREFFIDLRKQPDKILETAAFLAPGLAASAEFMYTQLKGHKRIFIGGVRGSATFISPTMSAEYFFPSLKLMVDYLVRDGFQVNLHLDTDWTPMLELFNEFFPHNKGITLQLENTDLQKAKEICGAHFSLMGNINSTLQRLGTPHEIEKECRKLITTVGEGGGFILSSGCEVAFDAPFENIKTIIDSALQYGVYRK
ncbi:MAG: uroporphyrinogen decarboxylase family protein [Candidatus Helarchaeota archaeon]